MLSSYDEPWPPLTEPQSLLSYDEPCLLLNLFSLTGANRMVEQGLFLIEDFVSAEEEAALIAWIDADIWQPAATSVGAPLPPRTSRWAASTWNTPGAGNEGKSWGAANRAGASGRLATVSFDPLPLPLLAVAERMAAIAPELLDGGAWRPNQANAISYTKAKGHYLGAHCDDRQLSGLILCNLSLGARVAA